MVDAPLTTEHFIAYGRGELLIPAGAQLLVASVIEEGEEETWGLLRVQEPDVVVEYRVTLVTDKMTFRLREPQ